MKPVASQPDVQERFQALRDKVSQFGRVVAAEIDHFQPDLVVGLAHSGWLPVLAAQVVWEVQYKRPFPPTLRINFGREKLADYFDLWGDSDMDIYALDYAPDIFLAHILWWVSQHTSWQTELRSMAAEVLPDDQTPQRILLVDECIQEGTTYLPVIGLFTTVFPQTDIRFVADGLVFWGKTATMAWLHQYHPQVETNITPYLSKIDNKEWEQSLSLDRALRWVAAGSEDVSFDSLVCAPVDQHSQTIARLSPYLIEVEWLKVAPWAHHTILTHVRQQAQETETILHLPFGGRGGVYWQLSILQQLWQAGSLSRRELLHRSPKSEAETQRWLDWLLKDGQIVPVGWGRATRYCPGPAFQPDVVEQTGPQNNAYAVLPDRLWAGPHVLETPYYRQGLRWLHAQGIQVLLDTTGTQDELLTEAASFAQTVPFQVAIQSVTWQPRQALPREELLAILIWLEEKLGAGQRVYIQSKYGSGRASLVAAAYLVRQGMTPQQTWQMLQDKWGQTTWGPYLRLPDSEQQRRFLLKLDQVL